MLIVSAAIKRVFRNGVASAADDVAKKALRDGFMVSSLRIPRPARSVLVVLDAQAAGSSVSPVRAVVKLAKNSPVSFCAVDLIKRFPSAASFPPTATSAL